MGAITAEVITTRDAGPAAEGGTVAVAAAAAVTMGVTAADGIADHQL